MSTDAQVNADYFMYCCYYIYSVNNDTTVFDDTNSSFTLEDNGNGIEIATWTVPNVTQPTFAQLKQITPSQILTGKKYREINKMNKEMPKLMTIFRDIYNRLVLPYLLDYLSIQMIKPWLIISLLNFNYFLL